MIGDRFRHYRLTKTPRIEAIVAEHLKQKADGYWDLVRELRELEIQLLWTPTEWGEAKFSKGSGETRHTIYAAGMRYFFVRFAVFDAEDLVLLFDYQPRD